MVARSSAEAEYRAMAAATFVGSNYQPADIFTKSLRGARVEPICNKLGAYNMYALA